MKGIFIPLLFAIFGGRAICEDNLPTGTDPNKVAEIYAKPQNTDPSKLSYATITHGPKLEVGGEETSRSLNDKEKAMDDQNPKTLDLGNDVTCNLKNKGDFGRLWDTKAEIECSYKQEDKSIDLNSCITNTDGSLEYSETGGNFGKSCANCKFKKQNKTLECTCKRMDSTKKLSEIKISDFIAYDGQNFTCKLRKAFLTSIKNLDALILYDPLCNIENNKKPLELKTCFDKGLTYPQDGEKKYQLDQLEYCYLEKWTLKCKQPGSKEALNLQLTNYVDFTKCPLECNKKPEAQKKSLI